MYTVKGMHMISVFLAIRDVNVVIFQKNYRFVMKTTTKNRKQNNRFLKMVVFKTLVFIKFVVSLTIVNQREDQPEGHLYFSLSSFQEKIEEF